MGGKRELEYGLVNFFRVCFLFFHFLAVSCLWYKSEEILMTKQAYAGYQFS